MTPGLTPLGNFSAVFPFHFQSPYFSLRAAVANTRDAHAKRTFWVAASIDLHTGHYFLTFSVPGSCECQIKWNPSEFPRHTMNSPAFLLAKSRLQFDSTRPSLLVLVDNCAGYNGTVVFAMSKYVGLYFLLHICVQFTLDRKRLLP